MQLGVPHAAQIDHRRNMPDGFEDACCRSRQATFLDSLSWPDPKMAYNLVGIICN
jgi:hypothetical protein